MELAKGSADNEMEANIAVDLVNIDDEGDYADGYYAPDFCDVNQIYSNINDNL